MTFNGRSVVFVGDEIVEVPDHVEVVSKKEVKVKVDGGWEGTHIITVTLDDIKEMAKHLGSGIMTKSCLIFKGVAWEWRAARNFINEMYWWFQLLKENSCQLPLPHGRGLRGELI